jgi:hypothetical protein
MRIGDIARSEVTAFLADQVYAKIIVRSAA